MFLRLHLYLERFFLIVFLLSTINKLIIIIIIIMQKRLHFSLVDWFSYHTFVRLFSVKSSESVFDFFDVNLTELKKLESCF